jgi:threonine dehydratase
VAAERSVTIDDVRAAAAAIDGAVVRTPSSVSHTLSELLGCTVIVKFENLQFVASFKERGALNRLLQLTPAERAAGVVAVSAGNHAQAVARHTTRLGIPATIVMPATTP